MRKLRTEQNTPAMERRIMAAAIRFFHFPGPHHHIQVDFEHGHWWATCTDCGAQWSVVDAEGPGSFDGFSFERVSEGDESCQA